MKSLPVTHTFAARAYRTPAAKPQRHITFPGREAAETTRAVRRLKGDGDALLEQIGQFVALVRKAPGGRNRYSRDSAAATPWALWYDARPFYFNQVRLMARTKKTVSRKKRIDWSAADIKQLRKDAGKKPLTQLARAFKRTPVAVQLKASKLGISLRRPAA
jgi:hypothetical protein